MTETVEDGYDSILTQTAAEISDLISLSESVLERISGCGRGGKLDRETRAAIWTMRGNMEALLELIDRLDTFADAENDSNNGRNIRGKKWIETADRIIGENLTNDDFSVEMLAEKLSMSQSSLQRKIKKYTGESPNEYIRNFRLKTALRLLLSEECSIGEASDSVGFSSPSHFSRAFRERFGMSPREYLSKKDRS